MGATDLLDHLRGAGLLITLTPNGGLHVAPRIKLNDDHRAVIRAERDALVQALEGEAANDGETPTKGPAVDPDRWCWPKSEAMNSVEIDTFVARLEQFTNIGLPLIDGESLADKLVVRDREADDRRFCLECRHLYGVGQTSWRCGNWQAAGIAIRSRDSQLPADLVLQLQRCDGFTTHLSSVPRGNEDDYTQR